MVKNYDDYGSSRPPLGLGYLSESLKANGIEHDVLDLNLVRSYNNVINKINEFNPDLIGISIFTNGHLQNYELIKRFKQRYPHIKIAVGGPHVSVLPEATMSENDNIDFAIVNEAEDALVELCKGKELAKVDKLLYRNGNEIRFNAVNSVSEKYITDLDSIPWPKYERFQLKKYIGELFVITSRGCPYQCMFCSVRNTMGPKVRVRSIPHVMEELGYWYKKGRRIFNFVEDNLTFYYDRVFELCEAIEQAGLRELILRASNGIRADRTDGRMLKRMKEVGFKSIAIAVEGANEKMMKILKKGETLERVEECIHAALALDYEISLTFVYGAPGETMEDIRQLIALAKKYPVFKVDIYNLVPYPGTPLWSWVQKNNAWAVSDPLSLMSRQDKNLKFTNTSGYPFFVTKELSKDDKIRVAKKLRDVTLQIQYQAFSRQFSCFGPLRYIIARFLSTSFFNRLIFGNNLVRRLSEKIRFRLRTR